MIEYAAGGTYRTPVFFSLAGIGYRLHSKQWSLDLLDIPKNTASAATLKATRAPIQEILATKVDNHSCLYLLLRTVRGYVLI
jgi:hypothetical protein